MRATSSKVLNLWWAIVTVLGILSGSLTASVDAQTKLEARPQDEQRVREVWERLMAVLDVECPEGYDVWPPVLDPIDPAMDINARATYRTTEDGKVEPFVVINNGWVQQIAEGKVDRLAFVLGHELGHHVCGHPRQYAHNPGGGKITSLVFTREAEEEADTFGLQIALKAGFSLRGAIDTWKRFNELGGEYSSFEGKGTSHPSWTERIQRLDQGDRAPLWESMIAFRDGVFLLQLEQYALAERCFGEVTKEFPDCYEAWANLGFAQLMRYCDALDVEDLRKYNLGQLALGAFYRRPASLEAQVRGVRGVDEELWYDAVGSLRQALALKRDLVVPKVNLGLAYLLSPSGPQVGRAEQFFEAALQQADQADAVDTLTRTALLINAAVTDLAAGRLDRSSDRLSTATGLAAAPAGGVAGSSPHFLQMAVQYNKALLLAATKGEQGRRDATDLLARGYLTQADPSSAWWTLAYEQYEKLCRELGIEPKPAEELQRRRDATWRRVTSITLPSGEAISLNQKPENVIAQLGPVTRVPVIPRTRLERLSYPDLGIDVLATDALLAIRVTKPEAGTIELRGTGLGTQQHYLKVGMVQAEFEQLVEREFGAQGISMKSTLRLDGIDALYRWYPNLGLAVLARDGEILELVIVPRPRA